MERDAWIHVHPELPALPVTLFCTPPEEEKELVLSLLLKTI